MAPDSRSLCDLPSELLLDILSRHIDKKELTSCALVNRKLYRIATPQNYRKIHLSGMDLLRWLSVTGNLRKNQVLAQSVQSLRLSNLPVDAIDFEWIRESSLTELHLTHIKSTASPDKLIECIRDMTSDRLAKVHLTGAAVCTDAVLDALCTRFGHTLTELRLDGQCLSASGLFALSKCTRLKHFYLHEGHMDALAVKSLPGTLETLDLCHVQFNNDGDLRRLSSKTARLKSLALVSMQLSVEALKLIVGSADRLVSLDLSGSRWHAHEESSEDVPEFIDDLPQSLEVLDLSCTSIEFRAIQACLTALPVLRACNLYSCWGLAHRDMERLISICRPSTSLFGIYALSFEA